MPDTKISALTNYTPPLAADLIPIVDTANATTKKLTWANLLLALPLVLLKANSGTDSTSAATNLDTVAISGLTAKDTLWIIANLESVTQATNRPVLYSTTDSLDLAKLDTTATIGAGNVVVCDIKLTQPQSTNSRIDSLLEIVAGNIITINGGSGLAADTKWIASVNTTTPWTSPWTLALRTGAGGVVAGGTIKWSWKVYVLKGQ